MDDASRARDAAAKCDTQERRELEEEAKQLAADLARRPHLNAPRLLADDVTPEQLATLMVENNSRMAVLSAEGTIFELMLGRYDKNGAPNLDLFLKSHSGDPLRVDRKNRGSEHVSDPALTLGLAVQPEVIRGLISNTALRGRGLLARFLYSIPAGFVGARDVDPPPLRSEIEQAYGNALTEMLARNIDPVAVIRLSEAARRTWLEFSERTERRLGTDGDFHLIREWAGKLPGAVARIAAVLHVASHFGGDWDQPLAAGTMAQAVRIGDYFSAHALAAFSEMGADPAIENVRALLRWLQRSGVEIFSKRDAFNAHRARFRRVQAMDPTLELLRQHGWVRFAETDATGGRGRPVSPVSEVNPLLPFLTHKSDKAQKSDSAATAISASMRPR